MLASIFIFCGLALSAAAARPVGICPEAGSCRMAALPSSFETQKCFYQFPIPVPDPSAPARAIDAECPSDCAPKFLTVGATKDGSPFPEGVPLEPFDFYVCYDGQWNKGRLFLLRWLQANSDLSPRFAHYSDKIINNCVLEGTPSCKEKNPKRCEQQCEHFSKKICKDCEEEGTQLGFPICDYISEYLVACS